MNKENAKKFREYREEVIGYPIEPIECFFDCTVCEISEVRPCYMCTICRTKTEDTSRYSQKWNKYLGEIPPEFKDL